MLRSRIKVKNNELAELKEENRLLTKQLNQKKDTELVQENFSPVSAMTIKCNVMLML